MVKKVKIPSQSWGTTEQEGSAVSVGPAVTADSVVPPVLADWEKTHILHCFEQ